MYLLGRTTVRGGASVGIAASLAVTPTATEPPCLAGVDHRPVRFVGLAGDYHGDYQGARTDAAYASIDPFSIEPSPHVEVRLLHGLDDRVVNAYVSGELVDHLVRRGVDARLVVTDHGHGDVIDPQGCAGAWVTDQVGLLVHARPSVFDAEPTSHLELGFDGRSCTYRGRTTLTVGDIAEVELRNATATGVSFGLASVAPDLDRAVLTAPTDPVFVGSVAKFGLTVSNRPSWILWGGFRFVPVRTVTPWRWAITDLDVDWLPVCFVDQPGHGRHGIVVLGTDPSGTAVLVEID